MFSTNKINLVLLVLLALTVSLGCSLLKSSPDVEKTESKSGGGEATDDNDESDDDLSLTMEDDDNEKDYPVVKKTDSKQTVVKFGKGKTSRRYENAVIRGEKHTYVIGASLDQEMSVNINSPENNAVFRVISPKGAYTAGSEEEGVKEYNEMLNESGKYQIVVSPNRGNATFKINFSVSAKEKNEPPSNGGGLTRNVKFRKGKSSAGYSGAIIRGESDRYILGASGGQLMSVSVTALENNAVFDIASPTGSILVTEKRSWSGRLPADGKYTITIGGTRGNATYKVNFSVR